MNPRVSHREALSIARKARHRQGYTDRPEAAVWNAGKPLHVLTGRGVLEPVRTFQPRPPARGPRFPGTAGTASARRDRIVRTRVAAGVLDATPDLVQLQSSVGAGKLRSDVRLRHLTDPARRPPDLVTRKLSRSRRPSSRCRGSSPTTHTSASAVFWYSARTGRQLGRPISGGRLPAERTSPSCSPQRRGIA
jgi:hypothetical protein